VAEALEDRNRSGAGAGRLDPRHALIVIAVAAAIFLGCIVSPPALMDDVDAVQAQIARNMLESGDWVSARLNGVRLRRFAKRSPTIRRFYYEGLAPARRMLGSGS